MKRLLALLLALAMLCGIPVAARTPEEPDYTAADAVFAALEADAPQSAQSMAQRIAAQAGVVPGSVTQQGADRIVWMMENGVSCVWSARYDEIAQSCTPAEPAEVPGYAEPRAITHGKDVYLIEPYYNIDQHFTGQYQQEAQSIANAMGGHYYLRVRENATIDKVAQALMSGGLVIFDSHGNTDYENGRDVTSGATTSYLCLSTTAGVTTQDYADHHANYSNKGGIVFCEVDGVAISNHMKGDATHTMIWAAICLGMATDGLCAPLMARGVDVMYGYSQQVSFPGDYKFEGAFFEGMKAGMDVAGAISLMKDACGLWDYSPKMGIGMSVPTIEQARKERCAFPIVASQEDAYPGHGNVDDLQEVNSTWRLLEYPCRHTATEVTGQRDGTCFEKGYTGDTVCRQCGEILNPGTETDYDTTHCALLGYGDLNNTRWYHRAVEFVLGRGIMKGSGSSFNPAKAMTRAELATLLWNLENRPAPQGENPFSDVAESFWGRDAIVWAAENGIVQGSGGRFSPGDTVTREQVAVMLYNYAGGTVPEGNPLAAFADADRISRWAMNAMTWAAAEGLMQGSGGKLNPKSPMQRAEVAQLMLNYLG